MDDKVVIVIIFTVLCVSVVTYGKDRNKSHLHLKHCIVNQNDVKCVGASYIGALPQRISKLIITKSVFHYVNGSTFKNLTNNKIKTLKLYGNGFKNISNDAFIIFSELSSLEISNEPLLSVFDVRSSLEGINKLKILDLSLTDNSWHILPDDMFRSLNGTMLRKISVDENNFSGLNASVLNPLKKLRTFSCRKCNIRYFNTNGRGNLEKLLLSNNNLNKFPIFCGQKESSELADSLENFDLSTNSLLRINPQILRCLKNVRKLIIDSNPIQTLETHTFAEMKKIETLSVNDLQGLRSLEGSVFASKTLKRLRFQRSFNFYKKTTYELHSIFDKIPNLSELDLTKSVLPHQDHLFRMFSHLRKMNKLILASTRVVWFPDGFFQNMPFLKELNLQGNRISEWKTETYVGLKYLYKLDLSGNQIKIIHQTSFPSKFLENITVLDLSGNPFSCTCNLKWFLDILETSNLKSKLNDWPKRYTCESPESLKHSRITKFQPSASECSQLRIFYIITISVCSVVVIFFFLVFVIFKCQVNIKNLIYFFRLQIMFRKGYTKIQTGSDFKYHLFIVYCEANRLWVHNTLLPKLENEGLLVCVHHRDFDIGKPITENIVDCMNNSWKMLVVLSNSFAKSEWCLWELDLVQERRRQNGDEAVIVVMYKEVNSSHMTSRLRSLLMTSSYLVYKRGIGEQMFWKAVLRDINKPLNFPPTSQL